MPTISQTLDHLEQQSLINNRSEIEQEYSEKKFAQTNPISIQILSTLGAIIAACFLIGSLGIAGALDSPISMFIWGVLAFAASFLLIRSIKNQNTLSSFSGQTSLALMVIAKGLITAAVLIHFDHYGRSILWLPSLTLFLLTIATYGPYNMKLDRFFSPLAFMTILQVALTMDTLAYSLNPILANFIFCLELGLGVWLLLDSRFKSFWRPFGLACLLFTCGILVMNTPLISDALQEKSHLSPYVIKAAISLSFLLTAYFIAKASYVLHPPLMAVLGIAIIAMALFGAEGILSGLLILTIGFHKSDRFLLSIGIIALSYFIFSFYYDLDFTLLQKSITLITSGGILLALSAYLKFKIKPEGAV